MFSRKKKDQKQRWEGSRPCEATELGKEKDEEFLQLNSLVGVKTVVFSFTNYNGEFKCVASVLSRCPKSAWDKEKPPNLWEHAASNDFLSYSCTNRLRQWEISGCLQRQVLDI